jgi:hypothetical protein
VPELDLSQALSEATEDVLSTMFFTMVDAVSSTADLPCTEVRIEFRGSSRGALMLCSSAQATAEMAANFLGLDADAPPEANEQDAVIKELANMICGAVLSRFKSAEVFQLLPPELLPAPDAGSPAEDCQMAEQVYGVGAGFLRLRFQVDHPA